jgi:DNA-binding IclR family transcriptional regulator
MSAPPAAEDRTGTQSVERAVALLRAVAARDGSGARLVELVGDVGLAKATVRRLLGALEREGLVEQEGDSRRYHLGAGLIGLGSIAGSRFGVRRLALPGLARLAEESGDTVYLSVRSALDAVCLDRREGDFPIRTLTLSVGDRRPLGIGAGSLALLSALPESQAVIEANAARFGRFGLDADAISALVDRTREAGVAFNYGLVVPGMSALGVAVRNPRGEPEAALSVAAVSQRMEPERRAWLAGLLKREAAALEREIARQETARPGPARR